jgi:hypothetical protein
VLRRVEARHGFVHGAVEQGGHRAKAQLSNVASIAKESQSVHAKVQFGSSPGAS